MHSRRREGAAEEHHRDDDGDHPHLGAAPFPDEQGARMQCRQPGPDTVALGIAGPTLGVGLRLCPGHDPRVTSKTGTGSENPLRSSSPLDWNAMRFPTHSSRTAFDTAMPPGEAAPHNLDDSCTAAPNRSPRSVTGSPTLMPMRRWMGRSASPLRSRSERWMSMPDSTADEAEMNDAMMPSPVCFTS